MPPKLSARSSIFFLHFYFYLLSLLSSYFSPFFTDTPKKTPHSPDILKNFPIAVFSCISFMKGRGTERRLPKFNRAISVCPPVAGELPCLDKDTKVLNNAAKNIVKHWPASKVPLTLAPMRPLDKSQEDESRGWIAKRDRHRWIKKIVTSASGGKRDALKFHYCEEEQEMQRSGKGNSTIEPSLVDENCYSKQKRNYFYHESTQAT